MEKIIIFVRDAVGNQFQTELTTDTTIGNIAADFFEMMEWPQQDAHGRGQKAVVELMDPKNHENKRLRADLTLAQENIKEKSTLIVITEAIAGAVDQRRRLAALKTDLVEMNHLVLTYPKISFINNKADTPDFYEITFRHISFKEAPIHPGDKPELSDYHVVRIHLSTEYPREAPMLQWVTPIFHPNVSLDGDVCLGQLNKRYIPSLGLKRIVLLLNEMLQWRNYDFWEPFNQEAANFAAEPNNWAYIEEIGGHRFSVPYRELINPDNWGNTTKADAFFRGKDQPFHLKIQWEMDKIRPRILFNRVNNQGHHD